MPAVKKPGKRPVRKKLEEVKAKRAFLFQQTTPMKINDLKPHPQNPNEGDIDMIKESIKANGVYRPVIFNKRNGFMAAGHHQWLAMRQLNQSDPDLRGQFDTIPVVVIDVEEKTHLRIMLADNATADRRSYNERILDEVLQSLGNITGTGYTELDMEDIHARASQAAAEAMEAAKGGQGADGIAQDILARSRGGGTLDDEDYEDGELGDAGSDDSVFEDDAKTGKGIAGASDELAGAFQLKEDMAFDGVGTWGIPRIRTDSNLLCGWDDIPDNFRAWAGSATKDWPDPGTHWLYNVGIDSVSGMTRDPDGMFSHVVIGFYCHDEYFDGYWWNPAKLTTKLLNSRINRIVMPDYSMHTPGEESRVISLWSLYRSRWLARYFQEAGMKLIPEVTWTTEDPEFLTNFVLPTLPKKVPMLAIQTQTIDAKKPDLATRYWNQVQEILDTLKPKDLLIYHGKQGRQPFEDGTVKFKGRIKFVESRMYLLAQQEKKKSKKTTL